MIKDKKSVNNYSYGKMNGERTMAKKKSEAIEYYINR